MVGVLMVRIAIHTSLLKYQQWFQVTTMLCYLKYLIKEVDIRISAVIVKNPNILGEMMLICLVDTI